MILKWIFKEEDRRVMDWIDLTWDRDRWRVFVNGASSIPVP